MSALPEEALLGSVKRMFESWDADGLYYSRCTIIREDGVPENFIGRASSPKEAKKKAINHAVAFLSESPPPVSSTKPSLRASTPRKSRWDVGPGNGVGSLSAPNAAVLSSPLPLRSAPLPSTPAQNPRQLQHEGQRQGSRRAYHAPFASPYGIQQPPYPHGPHVPQQASINLISALDPPGHTRTATPA